MRVLSDSWCFCNGGGKSERLKANIFSSKSTAMAMLSSSSTISSSDGGGGGSSGEVVGSGFLIHRNLLLTTHVNLPSASAAESAEIRLQNGVPVSLVPHRFFITSSVLDLTIVGLDYMEGDSNAHGHQTHCLKTCSKPNLDLGSIVYLLGYTAKKELTVGEGKVIIATDNLIKLSTDGVIWRPGSAGFDAHGNLAFMICDPMKMATSPHTKSSSTSTSSSSSWKKDLPMQFGIPMPVICDWLNQHWEGSLDEQSKPKLPLMRLVSAGHRSEHHCASFTKRQIFKPNGAETEMSASSSSNVISKPHELPGSSGSATEKAREEEGKAATTVNTHAQGIPTPEIYESPKVTAIPIRKKETPQVPLLDINFPQRVSKAPIPLRCRGGSENAEAQEDGRGEENAEVSSTGSVNGAQSEVRSSASPVAGSEFRDGQSEVETMYSAETAESRNYTSPREAKFQQAVGRSQSCVNYNRWAVHKYPVARKTSFEKQRSFTQPRRTYSQGATSHRSNDYYSPTVSSIMKKRIGNLEPPPPQPTPIKTRQIAVNSSPRWMF